MMLKSLNRSHRWSVKAQPVPETGMDSLKLSTVSEGPLAVTKHFKCDAYNYTEATAQFGVTKSRAFYIASRLYNSGSVASSNNLQDGIATHCYASDIANRLTGWVFADHGCSLDG